MSSQQRTQQKQEIRKSQYKKGIDPEEERRKREETTITIRKSKKEENLLKKRNVSGVSEKKVIDASIAQKVNSSVRYSLSFVQQRNLFSLI